MARNDKKHLGSVICDLARQALRAAELGPVDARSDDGGQHSGLPLLPTKSPDVRIDMKLVHQLRDDDVFGFFEHPRRDADADQS